MIDALRNQTYMVRHNPNCPKPFEVRLTGLGLLASLVWRAPNDGDDKGYGDTIEEAAENALMARAERLAGRKSHGGQHER